MGFNARAGTQYQQKGEDMHDGQGIVDPETGQPRLHAEKCATCVFWPDNRMHLRPGRLKEMVDESVANGSWIRCHERLEYGPYADRGEAVCRGFYDAVGERSQGVRIVQRLGGFTEVPIPPDPRQ